MTAALRLSGVKRVVPRDPDRGLRFVGAPRLDPDGFAAWALAVGTAMAPQFSVPLANAAGWQLSIGSWALLSGIVLGLPRTAGFRD